MRSVDSGCHLCPRACGANRQIGECGVCGCDATLMVARAALHMWEEPCISGDKGSGAVFFSGCPLHCIYCQNAEISSGEHGKRITVARLAEIFLELQAQGAANINLVTAGQWTPQVAKALHIAQENGMQLPVILNSGGYERVETLRLLAPYVSAYLPDFKYLSPKLAGALSHAKDYPEVATQAIDFMVEQAGEMRLNSEGYLQQGVIVRHLVLPGHVNESLETVKYLHKRYGNRIYLSLLQQYTPPQQELPYPELNRRLTRYEYAKVVDYARSIGVENGYIQEHGTAKSSFIPAFDGKGV